MEALLNYLNEFAKIFNKRYFVKVANEFAALLEEEGITVAKTFSISDFYFISNMYRFDGGKDLPLLHPFTWSFLHELGHLETSWNMVDDADIRERMMASPDSPRDSFEEYCQLHNERLANDWARDFVATNKELARHFDRHITELITNSD